MPKHGINCPCIYCHNEFEAKGMSWDSDRRRYVKPGGTMNSTAFKTRDRADGKRDTLFNGPGDKDKHGHVVESKQRGKYHFVRDVEGNEYINDRKRD